MAIPARLGKALPAPQRGQVMQRTIAPAERAAMGSANRLKLGLFGANCSSGRAVTTVPERWSGSWADCLALAHMADAAGIEFMLPIGRWKGYGGDTDYQGATFETVTWACGLLAQTERLTVFGTVHAPLIAALIAAKEFVTADHIGEGRFGLNLVCGWNEGEFEMFGATLRDHESRYDYAQEWLDVVKLAWSPQEDFDFDGRFIRLKKGPRQAETLRRQPAADHERRRLADRPGLRDPQLRRAVLARVERDVARGDRRPREERARAWRGRAAATSKSTPSASSPAGRPLREAEEYWRHSIVDNADWGAVDNILAMRRITPQTHGPEEFQRLRNHQANGMGGLPLVGDPDAVAQGLARLAEAGLTGIAVSFVNYLDELPYFRDEVLPRLARLGLRERQPSTPVRRRPGPTGAEPRTIRRGRSEGSRISRRPSRRPLRGILRMTFF